MIKSMTGYGKAEFETGSKKITVELKSLNSKQIDINTRTPMLYREKEIVIRKEISEKLIRGKIDFSLFIEDHEQKATRLSMSRLLPVISINSARSRKSLDYPLRSKIMQSVMRLPDTVKTVFDELDEKEWQAIFTQVQQVIQAVDLFRIQEGEALSRDIRANIAKYRNYSNKLIHLRNNVLAISKPGSLKVLMKLTSMGIWIKTVSSRS